MFKKHSSIFNNSKQRWSLRKMSIGLTSVLLGFIFLSGSQTVKADTVSGSETQQSSTVLKQDKQSNSQGTVTDGEDATAAKQEDSSTQPAQSSATNNSQSEDSTTSALKIKGASSQNNGIALYESKVQGSDTDSEDQVTKNDQEKAKQLSVNDINKHIVDKYQKVLDEGNNADDWQKGLPTHEQQEKAEVKNGTKILVDNPGWGPRPLVNNTIVYNGKSYKYIYQNTNGKVDGNVSSVYGMASADDSNDWIAPDSGFNFSNNLNKEINGDQGYTWRKTKDGDIVIEHKSSRDEIIVNKGGAEWDINKDNGQVTVSDNSNDNDETDGEYKEFDTNLGIKEDVILTPEGNIVHKLTFTNNGNKESKPMPFTYYTLIDTAMNGEDGAPVYTTMNCSLYISNNGMVYGIRKLGDGELDATDYNFARLNDSGNLEFDVNPVDNIQGYDEYDWPLTNTDDTAIRVSTPAATLKKGESVSVWYIETAFPLSALKGEKIQKAIDDQLDLPVKEWIDNLENKKNDDQKTQDDQDKVKPPLHTVDDITANDNGAVESPITTDNPVAAVNTPKKVDYSSLQMALNELLPQLQDFMKSMGGQSVSTINLKPVIDLNNINDLSNHMEQIHELVHPVSETMTTLDELHGSIRKSIVELEHNLPKLNTPSIKVNKNKRIKLRASLLSKFNREINAQVKKANSSFTSAASEFKTALKAATVDFLTNNGSEEITSVVGTVVEALVPEKATAQVATSWLLNQINQSKNDKASLNNLVDNLINSIWSGDLTIGSKNIALSINGEKIQQNIFHNLFEAEPQQLEKYVSNMILGK